MNLRPSLDYGRFLAVLAFASAVLLGSGGNTAWAGTAGSGDAATPKILAELAPSFPAARPDECADVNVLDAGTPGVASLTLVVHGWNDNPRGEFAEIAAASAQPGWDATSFDWEALASQDNPDTGGNNRGGIPSPPGTFAAKRVGRCLAYDIYKHEYTYVHVIAHSLGTYVADSLVSQLKTYRDNSQLARVGTHVTLLDSYIDPNPLGSPSSSDIEKDADFSDQYRHDCDISPLPNNGGCAPFTNNRLGQACNFVLNDLVAAPPNSHRFPIRWYRDNIGNIAAPWGYSISREQAGVIPTFGSLCSRNSETRLQWFINFNTSTYSSPVGGSVEISAASYRISDLPYKIEIFGTPVGIAKDCDAYRCGITEHYDAPITVTYFASVKSPNGQPDATTAGPIDVVWHLPYPIRLAFSAQTTSGSVGGALFPLAVQVRDENAAVVTSDNTTQVTLSKLSGPGDLTCIPATVTVTGGVAPFANCTVTAAGSYVLHATAVPALTPADSAAFVVSGGTLNVRTGAVSAGNSLTCALTAAGGVRCWGGSYSGTAILGGATTVPVDVVGLASGVVAVSTGENHTCALTAPGGLKCWGANDHGQLGDGTTTDRPVPVDVVGLQSGVVAVSAGYFHTCAVTAAGSVKCWGSNDNGQLGDGTTATKTTTVDVVGLASDVVAVSAGAAHTCALTTAGGVKCWGQRDWGTLGNGDAGQGIYLGPVDVLGLATGVVAVSAGAAHTCVLTSAGGLKCWGLNGNGELGDGTTTVKTAPVDVVGLSSGVIAVSSGNGDTCAVTSAGGLKCWGFNANGELGDGTTNNRLVPADVVGLSSDVMAVATRDVHTCAMTAVSHVKCWGANNGGQLGDGTYVNRYRPVDVVFFGGDGGGAVRLTMTQQPPTGTLPGFTFDLSVAVQDSIGAPIANNTTRVTLSLGGDTGTLTCLGDGVTETVSAGVAHFVCSVDRAGTYLLHAASDPPFNPVDSQPFEVTNKLSCGGRTWNVVIREHDTQDYTPDWRDENAVGCAGFDRGVWPDFRTMPFTNGRPLDNIVSSIAVAPGHQATLCAEPGGQGVCNTYTGITDFVGWDFDNQASSLFIDGTPASFAPVVTGLAPASGPAAGGTVVTVTGARFSGATIVSFGGVPAAAFTVVTDTQITATAPAHTGGSAVVTVATPLGTSSSVPDATNQFTYLGGGGGAPTLVLLSPGVGGAGTVVLASGLGFDPAGTNVLICNGSVVAANVGATNLQFTVPPCPGGGTQNVVISTAAGLSNLMPFTYTGATGLAITSITPNTVPTAGGTPVTILGSGFIGTTAVSFGGTPATAFNLVNDTQITATAPAHAVGSVVVTVTAQAGTSSSIPDTGNQAIYFTPPVTITSLSPLSGPMAGGTTVTVVGSGFAGASSVTFGGIPGTGLVVQSDSTLTVVSPPALFPGVYQVVVTSLVGSSQGNSTFTFSDTGGAPAVTGVTPFGGPVGGGTSASIYGYGLTGATSLTFGGVPATSFTVIGDGLITATTPAHAAGVVDVRVTTPSGSSAVSPGAKFAYAVPSVGLLTPPSGSMAGGGAPINLNGGSFTGATGVTFDGVPGTGLSVISDSYLNVVPPPHAPGIVAVVVTGPNGSSVGGPTYEYLAIAVTGFLLPLGGPTAGGTTVSLSGFGFTGATSVTFGGVPGTALTLLNDASLRVVSPPHAAGAVPIVVNATAGATNGFPQFVYADPPAVVTSISPNSGPAAGGTVVTITGTGFTGATGVVFGSSPAPSFTVLSDAMIQATAPPGAGAVLIGVVAPSGSGASPTGYLYGTFGNVTISGFTPSAGPATGGTVVTILGSGFSGATSVLFGAVPAASFSVVNDITIQATTPSALPGGATLITVTGPTGSGVASFPYLVLVVAATPTITSINPVAGPTAGGTTVVITGTGLLGATSVLFGGVFVPAIGGSDTQITAITPPHPAGTVPVVVVGPGGSSLPAPGAGNQFTYGGNGGALAAPLVTAMTPASGPISGGTTVTLTGTGFTGTTSVTFGGVTAGSFAVDSDTQITATSPSSPAGTIEVRVTTPVGTSAAVAADRFTYVTNPAPTVASVTPPTIVAGSGATGVSVTGSGFGASSTIRVNGTDLATTLIGSSLSATIPASILVSPGTLQVAVFNPTPGGGLSSVLPLLVTSNPVTVTSSNAATSTTPMVTNVATGGSGSGTAGSLAATTDAGTGTVAVAVYSAAPGPAPSFSATGGYIDVFVAPGSSFQSLTITYCDPGGGDVALWWTGSVWLRASKQHLDSNGCIVITVDNLPGTVPQLSQLTGSLFAAANSDKTPPTAAPTLLPGANGAGWNSTDVAVTWNWTDTGGSGIDPANCTASSTSSGEGTLTLSATCNDAAGNPGHASHTVKTDRTPPTAAPTQAPAATATGWNKTDVTVTWNWTDTGGSGIDPAHCTTSSTSSGEGTLSLLATCSDLAGNTSSASRTVQVDKTPPALTITSGPDGPTKLANNSFAFTVGADAASVVCLVDDGAPVSCASTFATGVLADGPHLFLVTAADAATNQVTRSRSFVVDTHAPQTTSDSTPPNPSQGAVDFSFSSDEPVTFECKLDALAFAACSTPLHYSGLADGSHTLRVRVTDLAGNVDPTPWSFTWVVDTTPPDTTITAGPTGTRTTGIATFTFVSTEPSSRFECSQDGATFESCVSPFALTGLGNGSHTVLVQAIDLAGNVDPTPASRTWKVDDRSPPKTTLLTEPPKAAGSASATFTYKGRDNSGPGPLRFECRLDAGTPSASWAACDTPGSTADSHAVIYTSLAEGSHTFEVRARDAGGNVDGSPVKYTWTVDVTKPVLTATFTELASPAVPYLPGTWASHPVKLEITCTDPGGSASGIAHNRVVERETFRNGVFAVGPVGVSPRDCVDRVGNAADPIGQWTVKTDSRQPTCAVAPAIQLIHVTGRMVPVSVALNASDNLNPAAAQASAVITSITGDNGTIAADIGTFTIDVSGAVTGSLRAVVVGKGPRQYTINFSVTDEAGNVGACTAKVTVR